MVCVSFRAAALLLASAAVSFPAEPPEKAALVCVAPSASATRTVRDFGAVGDGKTDDTAAIEAAVKAGTGAVYFPAGEYRLTPTIRIDLNTTGRLSLVGTGGARGRGAGP